MPTRDESRDRDERQAADNARAVAAMRAGADAVVSAARAAYERDQRDYQDWVDGNVHNPTDGAARIAGAVWRDQEAARLVQVLRPFTPAERVCPKCSVAYVGVSRFCPPCSEAAIAEHDQREAARAAQEGGVTIHEARHQWANLPPDSGRTWEMAPTLGMTGLLFAIAATKLWVSSGGPPWLVLTGGVGVGKSHLAEVAARELVASGKRVRWQPVGELLDRLRQNQSVPISGPDGDDNAYAHLSQVAGTPWLVLDDLGRSKPSAWVLDRLYALVNSRATRQARTLITTNETLGSMTASLGDAIADRVYDSHSGLVAVVTVSGPSFRTGR